MQLEQLAKIAAERKGISVETATAELSKLIEGKSEYKKSLALRHYLEDSTHPNHKITDIYDPITHIKE